MGNEIDREEGDVAVVGNKLLFTRQLKAAVYDFFGRIQFNKHSSDGEYWHLRYLSHQVG